MAKKTKAAKAAEEHMVIAPPNFLVAEILIRGNAPYVQNKFSAKAKAEMRATQEAGSTAKKGKKREAKKFKDLYEGAKHIAKEGWEGIPAPAFRNACISACRMAGFQMTRAKLSIFILPDGFDKDDDTPLVKITKGKPMPFSPERIDHVRNASGVVDLRPRPRWEPGWEAKVKVRFDADQFTLADVANLMMRAGVQVGVGEGRPDSKSSAGMGWGTFDVVGDEKKASA
jgi:hypothetical protein